MEKEKVFVKDFDYFYDLYKQKALDLGRKGELRFIKERGKIIVYVEIGEEFGRPGEHGGDEDVFLD